MTASGSGKRIVSSLDGDLWHGPSLWELLEDVTPEVAGGKPVPNGHSIWEIVLHMTGWRNEVAQRATGQPAGEPAGGDYPDIGDPTAKRWKEALEALDASHVKLVAVAEGMSDDHLLKATNDPRNRPLGTGVSYYVLLHGIVQHDAYHAGQIAILKKVLGF